MADKVQAQYGPVKFWARGSRGSRRRRLVEHKSFGRDGSEIEDTGRDARHETIECDLTVDEFTALNDLIDSTISWRFTHPILGAFDARANFQDYEVKSTLQDRVACVLEFIEDRAQDLIPSNQPETKESKKQKVSDSYETVDEATGDLSDELTDPSEFDDLVDSFDAAYDALSNRISGYDSNEFDESDVSGALGELKTTGMAIVKYLRDQSTHLDSSEAVTRSIYVLLARGQDFIESLRSSEQVWFTYTMPREQDLWSFLDGLYGENGHDLADQVIYRNADVILDPAIIERGTVIALPRLLS